MSKQGLNRGDQLAKERARKAALAEAKNFRTPPKNERLNPEWPYVMIPFPVAKLLG